MCLIPRFHSFGVERTFIPPRKCKRGPSETVKLLPDKQNVKKKKKKLRLKAPIGSKWKFRSLDDSDYRSTLVRLSTQTPPRAVLTSLRKVKAMDAN